MLKLKNPFSQSPVWWVIAALWFSLWHFYITWSIWSDPTRLVPGPIGDNTVMLWNMGWVKHALDNGSPGFWFTNAYYPDGFLFLYGTHIWLDGFLYWLFSPLLPVGLDGTVLWANITMFIATAGTGLLLISTLRAWGVVCWPVLIMAASCAVFSWFRMFAQGGHYHFMGTHWMLLALCLLSWGRYYLFLSRPRAGYGLSLAAGVALGIAFLNDQTMVVFAAILGAVVIISIPAANPKTKLRRLMSVGALYFGGSIVAASVHLIPIVMSIATGRFQMSVDADVPRIVDATSLIFPLDFHLVGPPLAGLREKYGLFWSEGTYLGLLQGSLLLFATLFCIVSILSRNTAGFPDGKKVCLVATTLAWAFIVMALGDKLVIGREQLFTLPGRVLKEIPVLNNIRLPQRWIWPAHLCIALGGAAALNQVISNAKRQWLAWIPAVLAVIPPLEGRSYNPPQPLDLRTFPILEPLPVVEAVKDNYTSGSVLMMPLSEAYSRGNILQLLWGYDIPLTFSYTARMPYFIHETPMGDDVWSPDDAKWIDDKKVTIVVFPLYDENPIRLRDWIEQARQENPELLIIDRHGNEIP